MISTPNFLNTFDPDEVKSIQNSILIKQKDIEHFISDKKLGWINERRTQLNPVQVTQEMQNKLQLYAIEASHFYTDSMNRIENLVTNWKNRGDRTKEELRTKVNHLIDEEIDNDKVKLIAKIQAL
jgi:CO dehydrogenase/acetyl-CoA synthase alpha subunit